MIVREAIRNIYDITFPDKKSEHEMQRQNVQAAAGVHNRSIEFGSSSRHFFLIALGTVFY